ncbi:MAG TPA: ferritin-like domain-containing protein [Verrucomicrobiae bacterium]|nr:ferritin-like domain-containing protein [Verrucomicrobiae bacterium]
MEKIESLQDLLLHELKDMYHAEQQLVDALPEVIEKASSPELKQAIQQHLVETEGHVNRLELVFDLLGQPAKAVKCKAMAGILDEGKEMMKSKAPPETLDAGIVMSAQKVEHYEICAYGSMATWAEMIGRSDIKALLGQTLNEEQQADKKLTEIAKASVNRQSAHQPRAAA